MCPSCLFIKGIFELGLRSWWKPIPPASRARSWRNRLPPVYQNDQENKRNNLVPYLTQFKPLGEMVIFGTYLRAGRGSEVQKLHQKFRSYIMYMAGATSGGPNPKLMMTPKKVCLLDPP